MRFKRFWLAACLLGTLTLSACTGNIPITPNQPDVTLPPGEVSYVAPIGDAALEYTTDATLYLPRHDGTQLTPVSAQVSFSPARTHAESILRALLSYAGDGVARSLGGNVQLALYGVNPVEVSRDTVTVNLAASALQLGRSDLYLCFQAITDTLTELEEIRYVNFLVVDKPVGLDIANTLPIGAMTRSTGTDIAAAYEQLLTRRVSGEEEGEGKALSANVALYFPLIGTDGMVSEVRNIAFGDQTPANMVTAILRELGVGPAAEGVDSPTLPLLADLLTEPPAFETSDAAGGKVITLHFAYNLDDMLEAYGLTRTQSMASLCYTLATFFPNVSGVRVAIDGAYVESLIFADSPTGVTAFENGLMMRADFSGMICDYATLYLPQGDRLVPVTRPLPYYHCSNPRRLIMELAKGPLSVDSADELSAVMPFELLKDADILGMAIVQDTLLVNFAPVFAELEAQAIDERQLAYSLVNTLCSNPKVKSVCFFVGGSQFDTLAGDIYWRGLFYPIAN